MKKIIGISFLAVFCLFVSSRSEASSPARGAKALTSVNYTTTISTVSLTPAVLYSVILGSGAAGTNEFIAVFDTTTATSLNSGQISSASNLRFRLWYSSATSNTVYNFDPPLQFNNGIIAAPSAATGSALFVWEKGHVVNGY